MDSDADIFIQKNTIIKSNHNQIIYGNKNTHSPFKKYNSGKEDIGGIIASKIKIPNMEDIINSSETSSVYRYPQTPSFLKGLRNGSEVQYGKIEK